MKRLLPIILLLLALAIFTVAFLFNLAGPANRADTKTYEFEVGKGDTPTALAARLQAAGLVKSQLVFRAVVKYNRLGDKLQAGVYELSPSESTAEIASSLTHGVADVKVTIPEGLRNEEVAQTFADKLSLPYADVLASLKGSQGSLFPDTYFVSKSTTPTAIAKLLKDEFLNKTASLKLSPSDIILASLVERETRSDAEKPIVAGIYKKRLAAGWPLELDATIQYIIGKPGAWWPTPLLGDRALKSPYNTYLNKGLPPTPICNPGLASLQAILNSKDSPYWFYLHDKQGNIHFAATNAEQSANITKYIR